MDPNTRDFVNPYTFVPFPEAVIRKRALGHRPNGSEARERFSGSFTVVWKTCTPLSLPEGQGWYGPDGTVRIPGSSAKGAVRSVHEALFGGCPRVVTEDFVPVYRDPVTATMLDQWELAVVIAADDDGSPCTVRVCKDVVWVNAVALKERYGSGHLPTTGDLIQFGESPSWHKGLKRNELPQRNRKSLQDRGFSFTARDHVNWGGAGAKGWPAGRVLLVTDVAARPLVKNQHDAHRSPIPAGIPRETLRETAACFWATGELSKETAAFAPERGPDGAPIDGAALEKFAHLVEGARDRQKSQSSSPSPFREVTWWKYEAFKPLRLPGQPNANPTDPELRRSGGAWAPRDADVEPVARRRAADGQLLVGDVVWIIRDRGRVTGVKLAAAWRSVPDSPTPSDLGGRLTATPCTSWDALCLSCSIFGSADVAGDQGGTGQQTSYRGHVRFGSIVGSGLAVGQPVLLAPLSSPRPGAGMFYLNHRAVPAGRPRGDMPGRWGSAVDAAHLGGVRRLRGRKFYWHSDPAAQVAAIRAAGVHEPEARHLRAKPPGDDDRGFQTRVRLIDPGQALSQKITFDGLDRLSLLTLIAAFDPARILPDEPGDYAIYLGGGKPFGLGTVQATIDPATAHITSVAGRYDGQGTDPVDLRWTSGDIAELEGRVGPDIRTVQETAAHVFARHGLGKYEPLVTYPITVAWHRYNDDDFVRSFAFFGDNSGEQLRDEPRLYAPLPPLGPVSKVSPVPVPRRPHA